MNQYGHHREIRIIAADRRAEREDETKIIDKVGPRSPSNQCPGHAERIQKLMDAADALNGWPARRVIIDPAYTIFGYEIVDTPVRLEPERSKHGKTPRRYTTVDDDGNRVPMASLRAGLHIDAGWGTEGVELTDDELIAARERKREYHRRYQAEKRSGKR